MLCMERMKKNFIFMFKKSLKTANTVYFVCPLITFKRLSVSSLDHPLVHWITL